LYEKDLISKAVGKYIRMKRKEKGLTIEQLAEMIDMDDKNLGRIERGTKSPYFTTVQKIAMVLNLNDPIFQFVTKEMESIKKYIPKS
jgi:transcriptional regulator with XRE-family HTH domain